MNVNRTGKRNSKSGENIVQTKRQKSVVETKNIPEAYSTESETYDIESVQSYQIHKKHAPKSKLDNLNHLNINESGIGILSKTESVNTKSNQIQTDKFLLSFDVNSYFLNEKLSQISKTQPKEIHFNVEKSATNYEPPPNVTVLSHEIEDLGEEFLCSQQEWDQDVLSEGCHDDLSQFYDSSQVMQQIENVISCCDVVNDSFKQNSVQIEDKLLINNNQNIEINSGSSENVTRIVNLSEIGDVNHKNEPKSFKNNIKYLGNSLKQNIVAHIEIGQEKMKCKIESKFGQTSFKNANNYLSNQNSVRGNIRNANVQLNEIENKSKNDRKLSNIENNSYHNALIAKSEHGNSLKHNTLSSERKLSTTNQTISIQSNNSTKTDTSVNKNRILVENSSQSTKTINATAMAVPDQQVASTSTNKFIKNHSAEIKQAILKVKENEDNWDETIASGISQLFKSSQYKKEIATVFNNLETTICQISEGQDESLQKYQKNETVNWAEDTLENRFLEIDSQSISSIIKQTLINNVQHPPNSSIIPNQSLIQDNSAFVQIGPFYGLPVQVKELIQQYKGINDLYDWQDECLKLNAIQHRKNLVYALPTSGGKTLVSEILVLREILCRKHNVLFVLPYVSIVQEKVWALSPFALALDFLVEEYAAGKGTYPPRKRRYKRSVYIATIEKALGLINSLMETDRLKEIGLVVVDELHLMGETGRGVTLEMLLTKLIYAQENIHIVGMSATIGNLPEVCEFLKAEVYTKDFRPVELKEYVKCEKDITEVNRKAKSLDESLVLVRKVNFSYSEEFNKIDPDGLAGLVMEVIPTGSCLIFCASKKNCENVAVLLCRIFNRQLLENKKLEKSGLINLLRAEGNLCAILKRTVPFGVAYHHSGLTSDERRLIEDAFRIGTLCVICCTSTLAAGVNLPAKRVILRSPYIGRDFINLARYKQMSGRAGRAGMGEIGESILVCPRRDLQKVTELLCSPMDQVESKMIDNDLKGLRDLILSCIALGTATTRRTLLQITSCTLMAVQQKRLGENVKKSTDSALRELFKLGALQLASDKSVIPDINISVLLQSSMISESSIETSTNKKRILIMNDTKLVISKLGKAAIKGGLDLDTAHILYEDLVQAQSSLVLLNCLHLLYLVTPYELARQMMPSLPNYYSIYVELGDKELKTARVLGLNEACEAGLLAGRRIKTVNERVLNRFYLTLILYDLWNGKAVFEVAEKYQASRGLVQQLMVSASTFASNVVRFCEQLDEFWAFVDLLRGMSQRLQHCSSKELVPLMDLPSVKQGRARQLYRAGYKTLQSVARANPNDLVNNIEHISRRVANQLIASAKLLLLERVENLREEAQDVLDGIDNPPLV